ncbi:hypothetical protein FRC20_004132 [Serendipita sp. 405]|nr:hypothetical protein FRC16_004123 [Serendipita sp. 398]KAG8842965.1 hypothetical protein FRC20_004132 [Serendipita sp. 405]
MSTHKENTLLVTELLGYHPQLLLDELMASMNETMYDGTARVEEFLNNWIEEREEAGEDVEPLRKEVEYGMLALQTLLESYGDLAFDLFEAWSHRNIFTVSPDLPIVAPHHRGLDLEVPAGRERELNIEVETLRRKVENVRSFFTRRTERLMIVLSQMRLEYSKIRRSEAQAAQARRKAEALLGRIRFVDVTASESQKGKFIPFITAVRALIAHISQLRSHWHNFCKPYGTLDHLQKVQRPKARSQQLARRRISTGQSTSS